MQNDMLGKPYRPVRDPETDLRPRDEHGIVIDPHPYLRGTLCQRCCFVVRDGVRVLNPDRIEGYWWVMNPHPGLMARLYRSGNRFYGVCYRCLGTGRDPGGKTVWDWFDAGYDELPLPVLPFPVAQPVEPQASDFGANKFARYDAGVPPTVATLPEPPAPPAPSAPAVADADLGDVAKLVSQSIYELNQIGDDPEIQAVIARLREINRRLGS